MLAVAWEPISDLLASGLEPLLHAHWLETSIDHEEAPLAVDWSRFLSLERDGYFKAAGLRRDGGLIGYAAFTVAPHACFRFTSYATCNAIYVGAADRGYAGGQLVMQTEIMLRLLGVKKVIHSVPLGKGAKLGELLGRLGYKHTEDFYCKLVG